MKSLYSRKDKNKSAACKSTCQCDSSICKWSLLLSTILCPTGLPRRKT